MTTQHEIETWLNGARAADPTATHLIVVCDTFDYEDYPVVVNAGHDIRERIEQIEAAEMQRITEVYNLQEPIAPQMAQRRAWNL
jgi:hypothetical protein